MDAQDKAIVLVVDDDPVNIATLDAILREDYRIKAAVDGDTALAVAHGSPPPDLILLDVVMPGKDGFEVCRMLKQDVACAGIPVIFVTAKGDVSDESTGFAAGAVDYIAKPVNPHLVRARVKAHLELKRAREDLEKQNEILRENARLREEVEAINRHDLKNPLMIIMTVPQVILSETSLTEGQQKLLRMVEDAGRIMLEMINRTIDLYKMERGTYALKPVAVDILPILSQITAALGSLLKMKDLRCGVTVNGKAAGADARFIARGESLLVYSLLANLLKNAAEASPQGGSIAVSLSDGESVSMAIHNAGAIPEAIRPRFFQKFVTAGKQGGTGLGAYSASLIARTLGGSIGVETSEESGTTVTVVLPRA
jgi:two-component system, sensor histidine kinase and response regulator